MEKINACYWEEDGNVVFMNDRGQMMIIERGTMDEDSLNEMFQVWNEPWDTSFVPDVDEFDEE